MPVQDALREYARRIRELRAAHPDVNEPALAPAFQQLLTELIGEMPLVPTGLVVVPEFAGPGIGRPDIALVRAGAPARAFVELKAPAKPADPARWRDPHDRRQAARLRELALWATSNFVDLHLFRRDEALGDAAIVPERALRAETTAAEADRLIARHDSQPLLDLVERLARAEAPAARDAQQLAALLAHAARLVRGIVAERLDQLRGAEPGADPLLLVRRTFREVLYAHPEAGGYSSADFDALFSSAFAQTLAFGLLLVREGSGAPVGADAWRHMPAEHPLMRAALRVLSEPEIVAEIGLGFDVMCDTVNSFDPAILALRADGRDPILYFYEDFLETFDPDARDRYGVYYTPLEVVRFMAGALDRALTERLGTRGLRDPAVTILDPATGTGTFLLGVAERVRDQVTGEEGGPAAALALRGLAARMYGFELLVGPYAVAHYRLHHALRNRPADEDEEGPQPVALPRLGIYLADTLADPEADTPAGALGIQGLPIGEERREANRIKAREPILAIIGNPPYKRLQGDERSTLVGRWMAGGEDERGRYEAGVWDDLKRPVSDAGHGNQLNTFEEFSVAFWRWSMWKLFEAPGAPGRGVIAFITNRKFLTGWPYAGLRKMMRERFDRIEVIDLRGDVRAGPRGNVAQDEGVFDIMVGTAITVCIADGSKAPGTLAEITYNDAWAHDLFSRRAKLGWLLGGSEAGEVAGALAVDRGLLDDFRSAPFSNGEWVSLRECFSFSKSGMKSGNDDVFVGFTGADLREKVTAWLGDRQNWHYEAGNLRDLYYRPFDRRVFYNDLRLLNRPGPMLQRAWGANNLALYAMPLATGLGPATWCHGQLPDYHAFRGSYGGYAFPLHDRRAGADATNVSPALVAALSAAYGRAVAPTDVFDAILCLLSATSYTLLFAEDLEDVFPHVPFPALPDVFDRAVAIGREIRAVEAFARAPAAAFRPRAFCRLASEPSGELDPSPYADGAIALCADGTGRLTGIPQAVWEFAVSGYRVLPRWVEARRGLSAEAVYPELRDVAARIAELIHHFSAADLVLEATLADTLTRDELGFGAPAGDGEEAE